MIIVIKSGIGDQSSNRVRLLDKEKILSGAQQCIGNLLSFCLDVAQGHMKGAPNETRTHSCRFASRAC